MRVKKMIFAQSFQRYRCWLVLVGLVGLLVTGCRSTPPLLEPGEMQAGWGEAVYQMECARCHNPSRVAPLTPAQIITYRNAENLFHYISETMPLDKPGALLAYDYWAVTAYLMTATNVSMPKELVLGPETAAEVGFTFE
jgi:mono/diheme cytochrome c family protein